MRATLKEGKTGKHRLAAWQGIPANMRVLHITTRQRTGGWLAEAFAADSAAEVRLEEALGTTAGLACLREEAFDVVLVTHEPGELDALELIRGYRAGGSGEPVIVLGNQSEQEMSALCYEAGADGYVCVHTTTTRNLLWLAARAVQRHQLVCENHRLSQAEQSRLQREHDEAEQLLRQQRTLVSQVESLRTGVEILPEEPADACEPRRPPELPPQLFNHYRELLRTYVIMGSGNLACELKRLSELLVAAGVTAGETMQLHLHVLEELVRGLGSRSARHVMTRADLLILEVVAHLAEGYRQRYQERIHPPRQLTLPGFE